MTFARAHWSQIYSTNPLGRLNAELKRSPKIRGIFSSQAFIEHLFGAMMLEQGDESRLNRRFMLLEGAQSNSDAMRTRLTVVAC